MPRPSFYSRFYHPNTNGWAVETIKLLFFFVSYSCLVSNVTFMQ
jgi:hypothetical protein